MGGRLNRRNHPADAQVLGKLLEQHATVLEAGDIEARIAALEADAERRLS
jgi:hypothetical protein